MPVTSRLRLLVGRWRSEVAKDVELPGRVEVLLGLAAAVEALRGQVAQPDTMSVADLGNPKVAYASQLGTAWIGDAIETLGEVCEDESVDLIVTSPPFALQRPKEYGNESQEAYTEWFLSFADEFWRVLKPTGSLVIDLGGAWEGGLSRLTGLPQACSR